MSIRHAESCGDLIVTLNQSMQSSGIIHLPTIRGNRKLFATLYGDDLSLKAVKVELSLSDDGVSWLTPLMDDSLNIVLATTQYETEMSLQLTQEWAYAQFTLAEKIGNFNLNLEVAA